MKRSTVSRIKAHTLIAVAFFCGFEALKFLVLCIVAIASYSLGLTGIFFLIAIVFSCLSYYLFTKVVPVYTLRYANDLVDELEGK